MSEAISGELLPVRVLGFPLLVYAASAEHHEALMREFHLIAYGQSRPDVGESHLVPRRLLELIDEVTARYAGLSAEQEQHRDRALEAGEESIDLEYRLPASVADACRALDAMLGEADDFCRSGELLTLATPASLVAFREWFLGEFVRQLSGAAPMPWPEFLAQQPEEVRTGVEQLTRGSQSRRFAG